MGHSWNHGLVTNTKGAAVSAFYFNIGATGAVGTIEDFASGYISSITRVSAGLYRVKLNVPFPPVAPAVFPKLAMATPATSAKEIWYDVGTYNTATGEFDIQVTDRAATPAAADPANGDQIHVWLCVPRYKNL